MLRLIVNEKKIMRKHRLVKFIATSLSAPLGAVIIVACIDGSQKEIKTFPKKDSVVVQKQTDLSQRVFKSLETVVDTVYDDWHILVQTADNKRKVKYFQMFEKKLLVTVSKKGKLLFDKKEFTVDDFVSTDSTYQLYVSPSIEITKTTAYVSVGIYQAETDEGYPFVLAFSKGGKVKTYSIPKAWDQSDLATDFYVRYIHEAQQKPVDKASLIKLLQIYGSSKFVQQVTQNGFQSIFPTKVLSHHLRNIEVASEFIDSGDSTKISSKVYFYLYDTYTPFDSVYVEMKRDGEVNYGCVIDKVTP